ncbi:MAG: DUF4625 domain-containing protein [Flavobacteriales bacterium]
MVKCKFLCIVLITAVLFLRCNEDEDEARPTIDFSTTNTFSNDTIFLSEGEAFTFDLLISDDLGLDALRIFTSQSTDEIELSCANSPELFEALTLEELNGEQITFSGQIDFPDSISGVFSSVFQVLDEVGNSTQETYRISLSNASLPLLDSISFQATDSLCMLLDVLPMSELGTTVYARNEEGLDAIKAHWYLGEVAINEQEFLLFEELQVSELILIAVPELLATEDLILRIEVESTLGISAWVEYSVPQSD